MQAIYLPDQPRPKGHYAPAMVHNNTVYVSGQLPVDNQGAIQLGTLEEQTELCLRNMEAVLKAGGSDLQHVLKTTIYISDIAFWPAVNEVYARIMGDHRPARAIVPVGPLHYGCLVEIECIAALSGN
nr:RidA family protein [uncultured Arsenicibacter sp.]